jgi:hypothetical protein
MNAVLSDDLEPYTTSEATPEEALKTLRRYRGSVLIDLDETLYLRNSTEDFIDSARPALLALILMRLLDAIRPWRWTGGDATRDVWRVRCILLFFPWTRARWPRQAARLAHAAANSALIDALNERARGADNEPPVVATIGFEFIVTPLVAALGLPPRTRIIAARHSVFAERAAGKLSLLSTVLGQGRIWRSLVLTDSAQDRPLLETCALPLHTVWPQARFQPAFSNVYLPGQYLSRVKRPGERYISRSILQDDFAVWVLASLGFTLAQPLLHFAGLLCLLLSFWSIYECGYVDNDRVADQFEREPKLTREYREAPVATPRWAPWVWALLSGAAGAALLRGADLEGLYAFTAWVAVLLATYSVFLIYNRLERVSAAGAGGGDRGRGARQCDRRGGHCRAHAGQVAAVLPVPRGGRRLAVGFVLPAAIAVLRDHRGGPVVCDGLFGHLELVGSGAAGLERIPGAAGTVAVAVGAAAHARRPWRPDFSLATWAADILAAKHAANGSPTT